MTVATTTSRVEYAGNAVTVAFSVPFYFLANADLKVYLGGVLQTLTTHYSVTGEGNPAGGTVTFVSAPAAGASVVIFRDPSLVQETDYPANDPFPAESHERALDKLTMIAQRQADLGSRSLALPDGLAGAINTALPVPEANRAFAWNAAANAVVNVDLSNQIVTFSPTIQEFSGTGSQTAFTLNDAPGSAAALIVRISGVVQTPGVNYTVSGTTLTFTSAPPAGTNNIAVQGFGISRGVNSADADAVTFTQAGAGAVNRDAQSKMREVVSVQDFGAVGDGVADDTAAIQAALNAAAARGNAYVILAPTATYRCASGLTIDTNKVGLIGNGATLSFATMTTGDAVAITQSNADANVRNYLNHAHPISGVVFVGPGVSVTAVRAMYFNDGAPLNTISGGFVNNCAFVNFARDVTFGSGAFCITFEKCNFTILSGTPSTYSVEMLTGTTNAGERNVFRDCMWNNRNFIFNQTSGDCDTFFDTCSLDGMKRAMTITAGQVIVQNPHIETTDDTDYWFHVSGTNALLQISGGVSAVAASKVNFSPFYSDSTAVRGGVVIRDHAYLFSGASHTQYLVGGTGRADVSGLMQFASSQYPAISASFNALAYGGFESANYTAEWTLASGAVRSTAEARTGSYSLSFPASSGVTPSASCLIPCKPGQIVNGDYYYKALNITGTSGSFYAQIDYMDKGGNVISNVYGVAVTTTNVSAWTRVNLAVPPAPSGTVNVKLFWNIFGTTSGAPTAYIDDINAVAV